MCKHLKYFSLMNNSKKLAYFILVATKSNNEMVQRKGKEDVLTVHIPTPSDGDWIPKSNVC